MLAGRPLCWGRDCAPSCAVAAALRRSPALCRTGVLSRAAPYWAMLASWSVGLYWPGRDLVIGMGHLEADPDGGMLTWSSTSVTPVSTQRFDLATITLVTPAAWATRW